MATNAWLKIKFNCSWYTHVKKYSIKKRRKTLSTHKILTFKLKRYSTESKSLSATPFIKIMIFQCLYIFYLIKKCEVLSKNLIWPRSEFCKVSNISSPEIIRLKSNFIKLLTWHYIKVANNMNPQLCCPFFPSRALWYL